VAYQGTRETSRLWSWGGPLLELGLVRVHLLLAIRLEGVVVLLLPLRLHVGFVSVVAGVAALLLLLDLVLWHMVKVLIKVYIYFCLLKKERIHANERCGSGKKKNNALRIQRKFTDPNAK
jgi:hypothetical protein